MEMTLRRGRVSGLRREIFFYIFALVAGALALVLGLAEVMNRVGAVCTEASCMKVQTSSFNRVLGVPIPFVAVVVIAMGLGVARRRKELALYLFSLLAGAEGYMFFLQVVFVKAFCKLCIMFFVLVLLALSSLAERRALKGILGAGVFGFLASHFVFFYPSFPQVPWRFTPLYVERSITVYSSPSCSHCREAEEELRSISGRLGVPVFERAVPIREGDRRAIRERLARRRIPLLERVVDAYMWENEKDLKAIIGKVAVPTLVLRDGRRKKVLVGWDEEVKREVEVFYGKGRALKMEEFPWEVQGGVCTESGCR